jgi:hypothetical protein
VRKAALLGTIPPFLLKTVDNPEGVDGQVFEDSKAAIVKDRYAYFKDLTLIPVEGGPHNIGWTHPDEVNSALLNFLGSSMTREGMAQRAPAPSGTPA